MTELRVSDFCDFNIKSKMKFLKKDGKFINEKEYLPYILKFYSLYGFTVEITFDTRTKNILKIVPTSTPLFG